MGISKPIILEIAHNTLAINEFGMVTCYYLWGTERGLLIDTGCGMCNLREVVDELTTMPYDVVITHAHCDHAAGMDRWEKCWIHPADIPSLTTPEGKKKLDEGILSYPEMMRYAGTFDAYDIKEDQIRVPEHAPELLPMEDGHVFHLGGRDIEVMHTPGHTLGEVVLIDPKERILFSGDACNHNLLLLSTSVNTGLKGLLKLKTKESLWDRNFNGHIGYGGSNVHMQNNDHVLDTCIAIMRSIIAGTAEVELKKSLPTLPPMAGVTVNGVRVSFDPNRIIDPGEEPAE